MKKLTKIQLVNWHLFSFQTIEIKDNVLISGENGSGKSTLLDALQYVLIGERNNVKFNIAANVNAKRSLESYIRGKIGTEKKEFLRERDVITHIALEFYDTQKEKYAIFGCVLELSLGGILKEKFYFLENITFRDDIFILNQTPKNQEQFLFSVRQNDPFFYFFDTKKQYQNAIGKYLQINITKYIQILPKALAFKPLNLQNFVFDFLLEANPVNVSSLKNSVKQLKQIESQIELEQNKLKHLTKIMDIHKTLELLDNQIKINNLLERKISIEIYNNSLKELLSRKIQEESNIKIYLEQKKKFYLYIENLNNDFFQLETKKNSDSFFLFNSLQKDLAYHQFIYQDLKEQIDVFVQKLKKEIQILQNLFHLIPDITKDLNLILQNANEFIDNKEKVVDYLSLQQDLMKLSDYLSREMLLLSIKQNELQKSINDLTKKILDKNNCLNCILDKTKSYPFYLQKIISLLKMELSNFYNKKVIVSPLCELIDINDELWRNAIEGFLGNRKFNLIIDSDYFHQALKIYEKIQLNEQFFDIGLVNVDKIPYISDNHNSLATKITTPHKNALKYAKLLLSNVICEIYVANLQKHKKSITPQGMIYSNYTVKKLNPKTYQIPYIGVNSGHIRQKMTLLEIDKLQHDLSEKQKNFSKNESILKLIQSSQISHVITIDYLSLCTKLSNKNKEIKSIKENIAKLDQSQLFFSEVENKLSQIQREKNEKSHELDTILLNIAESKNNFNIYEKKIILLQKELSEMKQKLYDIEQKEVSLAEKSLTQLQNYLQKYNYAYDIIIKQIKANIQMIEQQKNTQKMDLIQLMHVYITTHHISDVEAKLEYLDYFLQEYNSIVTQNLIIYEQESKELTRKTEIIFKEEFINKLRDSIANAQQQIRRLNTILYNRPFGNDRYQLLIKPSENPEYKRYYSMIIDANDHSPNEKSKEKSLSYNSILLDELFQKIISFDEGYELIVNSFLDYRNYMTYDIQINDLNGDISLFSKIFREKSGGETQVPFYVIMAICFEQLLSEEYHDKGCLVLFDEAFNNMDENRIESMMNFFNDLKIQFLIAIPPQRIADITPHVTTNLIIVKDDYHVMVENFTQENVSKKSY
ncbi:ATP-binding protein [Candidatus Phytoplasma melaleucae]|uniref:AAA family ATPase n=1 Tax=Candidatus Phytoplasma melaleucae TaxID=2982630 RepID=A0ABT9DFH0_9MOLU|nr:SbcC/MukB-like Walker B domain-containing protein ['Melaleuca sp.' phytoplasma]MDO8168040.1 AAA family ATPase ['Melaleuca sp.' phytoplasma]